MAIKDYWLFSMSNDIIKWGTIAFLALAGIYLISLSVVNQDLKYPREHPWLFTAETLLFSFCASVVVFLMAYGRDDLTLITILEYFVLVVKFGLLHILLQFSGFYSYVFAYRM